MGTLMGITLYCRSMEEAHAGFADAFGRIAALDRSMSDYDAESELNRIGHEPLKLSNDLAKVLVFSQELAERSGGAFDVTVGALTRHWRKSKAVPLPDLPRGWRHLRIRDGMAWIEAEGVRLDLGGVAKGYASDAAIEVLRKRGIERALVAASGDIVCSKAPPSETGWTVDAGGRSVLLEGGAISTSGDRHQRVMIDAQRYSHILDPRSGQPLTHGREVAVRARRGMEADALATAISVSGDVRLAHAYPGAEVIAVTSDSGNV